MIIDWRLVVLAVLDELKAHKGIGDKLDQIEHNDPGVWEELIDSCIIAASEAGT
jgi:hypothetical protein